MAYAMILLPLVMAALAFALPSNRWRPWLLPVTSLAHGALVAWALAHPALLTQSSWLVLDPPGRLVLVLVSVLFCASAFYTVDYLRRRAEHPNSVFCVCFLTFLSMMTLVTWSHHLGLMWVAVEATTLVSAPLIYFDRTHNSIEATWKYLLVCSIGIALALMGSFFLAYASLHAGLDSSLTFENLLENAPALSRPWLYAAFVLSLVGYGTKMGLAPVHIWLPDAHSEAPSPVSALLSGALLNCAFLAILRIYHICIATGEGTFTSGPLIGIGLFSMAVAGLFMFCQRDFKRMLAYSSIEHMGILALGLGIGAPALFGTLLHILNSGLTKGVLFLSAGNIYHAYHSKSTDVVRGALRRVPLSGALFLTGFLAITGSPPFGPFISEFSILNAAFGAGHYWAAGLFLFFLFLIFIGMGILVLKVVQGHPSEAVQSSSYRDGGLTCVPPLLLMALVLLLGLYIPAPLDTLIRDAVNFLEVTP
ncbi:MAG TPA: proton-conducting transporter membrane subunit [Candidatus Sumerlaeota bacterium]|nr:proton-conducting transporter membrane subunit [Candidatus Sumerlaeota bacterium]